MHFSDVYDRFLRDLMDKDRQVIDSLPVGLNPKPKDFLPFPVPADWRGMMQVISNILQRAFFDFSEDGNVERVKSALVEVEKIIGPFGKREWAEINHGLEVRKYRKKMADKAMVHTEILSKLGLTLERWKKLDAPWHSAKKPPKQASNRPGHHSK